MDSAITNKILADQLNRSMISTALFLVLTLALARGLQWIHVCWALRQLRRSSDPSGLAARFKRCILAARLAEATRRRAHIVQILRQETPSVYRNLTDEGEDVFRWALIAVAPLIGIATTLTMIAIGGELSLGAMRVIPTAVGVILAICGFAVDFIATFFDLTTRLEVLIGHDEASIDDSIPGPP